MPAQQQTKPRPRKAVRVLASLVLSVVSLGLAVTVFGFLASLMPEPTRRDRPEKIYNVEVYDVESSDVQEVISAFGTARADREVVISAQVTGEIVTIHPRLYVGQGVFPPSVAVGKRGESVEQSGDLLVQIDPRSYEERAIQAESRLKEDQAELRRLDREEKNVQRLLTTAKADYAVSQREFNKVQKLFEDRVSAESEVNRARLELQVFEAKVVSLENDLDLIPVRRDALLQREETHRTDLKIARLDLQHTEVRPPFAGVISEVNVELGQFLRVGEPIVSLVDNSRVEIPLSMRLNDYAKLAPRVKNGERLRVELAENETAPARWKGEVVRMAPLADESTRTVEVYVIVENNEQEVPLLPGTFVHARIDGPVLNDVTIVPRDAILNGRLYVAANGSTETRAAKIKQTLQSLAVIDGTVKPGEAVILTNLDVIYNGAKVQVQGHRSQADELASLPSPTVRLVGEAESSPRNRSATQ